MLEQPFHSRCADAGLHRARAAGVVLLLPLLRERARVDGEPGVVLQVRVGAAQPRRQASAGVRGVLPRADGLERVGARREARREEQRVAVCAAPPRCLTARVRARHRVAGAPAQAQGVGVAAGFCSARTAGRSSITDLILQIWRARRRGGRRGEGLLERQLSFPENPVARFEEHGAEHQQRQQRQRERLRASLAKPGEGHRVDALGEQRGHARAPLNTSSSRRRGMWTCKTHERRTSLNV
jgi:hypothetical protein